MQYPATAPAQPCRAPLGQASHAVQLVIPLWSWYLPETQFSQLGCSRSRWSFPVSHCLQAVAPALANVPFSHVSQEVALASLWNLPAGQSAQNACPLADWNFPTPHGEQAGSFSPDWNCPALHS